MRIGLIVGEVSGDKLAASILRVLKARVPSLQVEGILGPECKALGFESRHPMERLSIMGLWEPLKRLPELLRIRRDCIQTFLNNPPDVFLGVDSPDFNLPIEKVLRQRGIKTIHAVSPSVWAWRAGRIKTIQRAVSLMLTLFPFETRVYQEHGVPVRYIGHPFADEIPMDCDAASAKQALGYAATQKIIGLLPGSRDSELTRMLPVYLQAAALLHRKHPDAVFVVPVVSEAHAEKVRQSQKQLNLLDLPVRIRVGAMRSVLQTIDVALVTSGTATLEVMLHQKPMVVAYKTQAFTYQMVKALIRVPYIALPNLLADAPLVTELIQADATPEKCAAAVLPLLENATSSILRTRFLELHRQLKCNAAEKAADAILG